MEKVNSNPSKLNTSAHSVPQYTRRNLIKSAAAVASAAFLPVKFAGVEFVGAGIPATTLVSSAQSQSPDKNPSWYGFNLLEYFSTDPDWMKYFPYRNDGMFPENDFRWIRDWGFNWVRLPMDYRFWTAPDLFTINENKIEPIDRALRLGERYGIHVNLCLHRAPGFCILDAMDEKLTGIRITKEKASLFYDPRTLDFYSWHTYADGSADPYDAVRLAKQIRAVLDTHGFPKAESILSEWNLSADFMDDEKQTLQGAENAAYIGAVRNYLQDAPVDHAQFYRGDAAWMGLFDLKGQYFKTAYTFKASAKTLDSLSHLLLTVADIFGFSVIAGRSEDGKSVQVFISNYAIPASYKPHTFGMPSELQKMGRPLSGFSKVKFLPPRTDIVYRNNAGYNLTISNLPWGNDAFTIKRYRISKSENFELVEEKSGAGGSLKLGNSLAPDAVELIVLQRK